jgi:methylmalonyl-CoA/ethylmalonyl-CoA epimerase
MADSSETSQKGIGTTIITQIGIVVRDIEKTARAYADVFGVPVPSVQVTDGLDKAHTRYMGEPSEAKAKLAFISFGQVTVELIEPIGAPSTWQDFLDEHGEGVHHIAFVVKGMDEHIATLTAQGVPLVQKGDYTGGRYAYLDGAPRLGVLIELLENFR